MTARLLVAVIAGLGCHLLVTSQPPSPGTVRPRRGVVAGAALRALGVRPSDRARFAAVAGATSGIASSLAFITFGGLAPSAIAAALTPVIVGVSHRHREAELRRATADEWPRLIEEVRIRATALGESIPSAFFAVGGGGPDGLRDGFRAAHREWLLTADFGRSLSLLKHELEDPTADLVCETLLIAHEVGGTGVERRLEALATDRRRDLHERKEADSRLAGARFARSFVLLVPAGMALAGMSIGDGRAAYRGTAAQVAVAFSLTLIALCWVWASAMMTLPRAERVFDS